MEGSPSTSRAALSAPAVLALAAILLAGAALRVPHLGGPIDEPHAWRQAETAQFARSFYRDGIDLLHPSVCWLGGHRALALEFPLPEAVVALGYRAAGREWLPLARIFSLLCYLGAAAYLFRIVSMLFGSAAGAWSAIVFLVLPLGLYYSRAVHVDPAALLCAHAAFFYALLFYEHGGWPNAVRASIWAALGFLIKAPYLFYLGLPVLAWIATRFAWRRALVLVLAAVPAIVAFLWWRQHALLVNAGVPDWGFIPGFKADFAKHVTGSASWFYGTPAERLDPHTWRVMAYRVWREVATPIGVMLLLSGLATAPASARRFGSRPMLVLWTWGLGAIVYVLVFYNLNVIHDYYQLPLLAITAAIIAAGLETFRREWTELVPWVATFAVVVALGLLTAHSQIISRRYYQLDPPRMQAAEVIERHTPARSLLVAATTNTDRTDDPRLLYRSDRMGWSVSTTALDTSLIGRLRQEGASRLAVVLDGDPPPGVMALEARYPDTTYALADRPWRVVLFDLGGTP